MSFHPRLFQAAALSFSLASCAVPTSGTNPIAPPPQPAVPVAKAPVAVPSLAPAPVIAQEARLRLAGSVIFSDQPVANATLTALDLSTGKAIALKAWSDAGSGATGTQRTDEKGAFDLELPKLTDDQMVKLIAVSGSQTFTALFDARGRAVGAAGAQGATYRLAQGQAVSITIRLKLTAATTAAAKAFKGALKLTFQLPKEAREAERAAAIAAAEQAAKDVEAALAKKPELAAGLVTSVGADGEVANLDEFRSTVAKLGVFDTVFNAVQGRLVAVTAQKLTAEGTLSPITAEDFPLDRVTITQGGGFTFTGGQTALGGALTENFVPTPKKASGGRRGGGDGPELSRVESFVLAEGSAFKDMLVLGDGRLAVADAAAGRLGLVTLPAAQIEWVGFGASLGLYGLAQASPTILVGGSSGGSNRGLFTYNLDTQATASVVVGPGNGYLDLTADQTRYYGIRYGLGQAAQVDWFDQADPSVASGPVFADAAEWRPEEGYCLEVFDDPSDVATPTLFVGRFNGAIVSAQDGGASRTVADLPSYYGPNAMALASPSLYVGSLNGKRVYVVNVNTGAVTTLISEAGGGGEVVLNDTTFFQPNGLAFDNPANPQYLYVMDNSYPKRIVRVRL